MIIGISGKKQSGKDTIAKIIQGLILGEKNFENGILGFLASYDDYLDYPNKKWEIKKFAEKLKKIVSILTGFTVDELEDENIKNTKIFTSYELRNKNIESIETFANIEELVERLDYLRNLYLEKYSAEEVNDIFEQETINITPRLLLQKIGTEVGREISPNIWIDSLFNQYKKKIIIGGGDVLDENHNLSNGIYNAIKEGIYPNWIITDVRFPNEAKAIKDRNGLVIRVNRDTCPNCSTGKLINTEDKKRHCIKCFYETKIQHESEIALDDYEDFDYTIDNNNCIDCLIEQVKEILKHEKII